MKKVILSCLAVLSVLCVYSQISIVRSDFVNVNDTIPRIYYSFEVDTESIPRDSVMPSEMVFDDPTDFPLVLLDSLIYFPSSESDPDGVFEGATCAFMTRDGFIMHLQIDELGVNLVGMQSELPFVGGVTNLVFVDTLKMSEFPCDYQDVMVDQGAAMEKMHISVFEEVAGENYAALATFYDTVRFFMDVKINSNFNEHGEIQFVGDSNQNGTFLYLREDRKMITAFDIQLRSKFGGAYTSLSDIPGIGDQLPMELPVRDTSYSHQYWVKDWKSPLLEIEYNTAYDSIYSMTFRYAYLSYVNTEFQSKLKVFPNPANQSINFYLEDINDCTLFVFSTDGRLIHQQMISSESSNIELSNWESGVYIYQIFDKNKTPLAGGKFIKQ
jgi:hypothetical protein